jgi:hypothetical protein
LNAWRRHAALSERSRLVRVDDFRGIEQARLDEETGLWERIA